MQFCFPLTRLLKGPHCWVFILTAKFRFSSTCGFLVDCCAMLCCLGVQFCCEEEESSGSSEVTFDEIWANFDADRPNWLRENGDEGCWWIRVVADNVCCAAWWTCCRHWVSHLLLVGKSCACFCHKYTILAWSAKGNELERLDIDPLNESFSRLADEKKEHLDLNKAGCPQGHWFHHFVLLPCDMKNWCCAFSATKCAATADWDCLAKCWHQRNYRRHHGQMYSEDAGVAGFSCCISDLVWHWCGGDRFCILCFWIDKYGPW